jgi:hypothetical protein
MPLIFAYGSLQQEDVQVATFGRRLGGGADELLGFERSLVRIEDPEIAARLGKTHHANVTYNGNDASRVPGMAFEITDAEIAGVDAYEAEFSYTRVAATLASGRRVWVYVDERTAPEAS